MAYRDSAPNVICAYAYELAGAVNRFYHETRILAEPDQAEAGRLPRPHPPCQARAGGVHRSAGLLRPGPHVKYNENVNPSGSAGGIDMIKQIRELRQNRSSIFYCSVNHGPAFGNRMRKRIS